MRRIIIDLMTIPFNIALVRVENSAFVIPDDPAKPWECWPGDTWDWSVPTPTNFE